MNINLTLIAQSISFALFILFTVKFVWPPLMKAIENRQKQIADGLAAGEQGKQQLEASSRRAGEEIGKARERAAEIVAHAEQRATRAREALREQVAALAVSGAEKILQREVDAQAHAELLAQLKQEL